MLKVHKIGEYLLRTILLIVFFFLIYWLVGADTFEKLYYRSGAELINAGFYVLLISLTLLQVLNYWLEAQKFLSIFPFKMSSAKALKAVYAGCATGLFTPDRIGNFIGRSLFLKGDKGWVIYATVIGNFIQLSITVFVGMVALCFLSAKEMAIPQTVLSYKPWAISFFAFVLFFLILLIFKEKWGRRLLSKFSFIRKKINPAFFEKDLKLKGFTFVWAALRYAIFYLQFLLLFVYFGLPLSLLEIFIFVGIMYGVVTFIPSPFLGNLGSREFISCWLLNGLGASEIVLFSSLLIWLVNVILPAVIGGSLMMLKSEK